MAGATTLEAKITTKAEDLRREVNVHAASLARLESADEALRRMLGTAQADLEGRVEQAVKRQLADSEERAAMQVEMGRQMQEMKHKLTEQMVETADFALQKTLDRLHAAQDETERAVQEAKLENQHRLEAALEELETGLKAHVRGEVCMVLSATQSELGHTLDHAKLEVDGLAEEVTDRPTCSLPEHPVRSPNPATKPAMNRIEGEAHSEGARASN